MTYKEYQDNWESIRNSGLSLPVRKYYFDRLVNKWNQEIESLQHYNGLKINMMILENIIERG